MEQLRDKIRNFFALQEGIHTVILYGSYAAGKQTAKSDIDVAVASPGIITYEKMAEYSLALEENLRKSVDIRDLRKLHGVILSQVLRKGIVLLKDDPAFFEDKLREMVMFRQDMLPILDAGIEKQLKEFAHGG